MATFIIDLMGDEDMIVIGAEKTEAEFAKEEAMRQKALEEIFRRAPQPALEIVPAVPITGK